MGTRNFNHRVPRRIYTGRPSNTPDPELDRVRVFYPETFGERRIQVQEDEDEPDWYPDQSYPEDWAEYRSDPKLSSHGPERTYLEPATSLPGSYGFEQQSNERAENKIRRFFGVSPKGYERSDERIREEVCDRLMHQGEWDPSEVEVDVTKGEVTLRGSVQTYRAKHSFENMAETVLGVREINNYLKVKGKQDRE